MCVTNRAQGQAGRRAQGGGRPREPALHGGGEGGADQGARRRLQRRAAGGGSRWGAAPGGAQGDCGCVLCRRWVTLGRAAPCAYARAGATGAPCRSHEGQGVCVALRWAGAHEAGAGAQPCKRRHVSCVLAVALALLVCWPQVTVFKSRTDVAMLQAQDQQARLEDELAATKAKYEKVSTLPPQRQGMKKERRRASFPVLTPTLAHLPRLKAATAPFCARKHPRVPSAETNRDGRRAGSAWRFLPPPSPPMRADVRVGPGSG